MYPLALSMRGRRAVVAGGGAVAERKIRGLLDSGAAVTVVAPGLTPGLRALASDGRVTWLERPFDAGDLAGAVLAFAATGVADVDAAVVAEARRAGALVNAAGDAQSGDFATPAVVRSGELTVTVDSGGLSPSFTRRIRDELAMQFDSRFGRAAATLGALRERTFAVVPDALRAPVMRHFAERDIDELAAMPHGAIEHEVERTADTVAGVVPSAARPLICATRASALAITQTRMMIAQLAAAGLPSTILEISTRGDTVQDRSIAAVGENVFVKELETALADGRADYAVHSCKDLPSALADGFTLAAVTARVDARDAYCSEKYPTFASLPPGARVGTSSPRRRAQLRALRGDLVYDDIRGNVDSRLRKLREGDYDAIVLACAGLQRLRVHATHTVPFAVDEMTPAVAQGALAIETRADAPERDRLREALGDPATTAAVIAERAFLRTLRGGCSAPIGCYGTWDDGRLTLIAAVAAIDGSRVMRATHGAAVALGDAETADALGVDLASQMLADGAAELLAFDAGPLAGHIVLLPRTQDRSSRIAPALRDAGAEVLEVPDSGAASAALGSRVPSAILFSSSGSVEAIGEYLAALRRTEARPIVAAMGPDSAAGAEAHGWPPDAVAPVADIGAFVQTVTRTLLETGR
jgi:hydroxymethylbilane synthase